LAALWRRLGITFDCVKPSIVLVDLTPGIQEESEGSAVKEERRGREKDGD